MKTISSQPLKALVFGASGYIGTNLVPRLIVHGYRVRASSRNRQVLAARDWDGVELVEADALSPQSLDQALESIDIAYYLIHSMGAGRRFFELEQLAAENFSKAAERAGIRRIVYLGGLIPPDAGSAHLLSRRETGKKLRAGKVPVTEIRAGMIVGPGSAAFEVIRDLVNNLPVMITPRWVKSKSPPIALENLLTYLVQVPEIEATAGGVFDVAGPEMLTYEDIMRRFGETVGKKPLIISVPVLSPRLSSYWLKLVTTVPTNIARALIDGLKHDIPANDEEIRALIPQQLLTFRESVAAVFEAERQHAIAAHWTEGALMFRNYRQDYAFYAKKSSGSATSTASVRALWHQVITIGGKNRYYYLNGLWFLRELMDWMIGGPGLRRSRRHPTDLRIGDTIDSWRVIGIEPERRLTLSMGMKAPGAGVLEFAIDPENEGHTRVSVTAYWHPAGIWGLIYWYALAPFHDILFRGMTRNIALRAEAAAKDARTLLMPALILYSTAGCHLCDQARVLLASANPSVTIEEVDIARSDSLMSKYGERIPVLLRKDTGEELGWPFQSEQLSQFLRSPQSA
jgi:uncharacterized protein YbjT (DUF2867 family)